MKLVPVGKERKAVDILYTLLCEREPSESISHKSMPTLDEHRRFVQSHPYFFWALIKVDDDYVGSVYITKQREIGIAVLREQRQHGYAKEAIRLAMKKWPGRFLANINPSNKKSIDLFSKLGFAHIQNTYEFR